MPPNTHDKYRIYALLRDTINRLIIWAAYTQRVRQPQPVYRRAQSKKEIVVSVRLCARLDQKREFHFVKKGGISLRIHLAPHTHTHRKCCSRTASAQSSAKNEEDYAHCWQRLWVNRPGNILPATVVCLEITRARVCVCALNFDRVFFFIELLKTFIVPPIEWKFWQLLSVWD